MSKLDSRDAFQLLPFIFSRMSNRDERSEEIAQPFGEAGLIGVIAGTRGGKTTLLKQIARENDGLFLQLAEPEVESSLNINELISKIHDMSVDNGEKKYSLLAIDSLRITQFVAPGNARKGGVSSGFYQLLTELSIMCLRSNVTIIVALNPLLETDDEQYHRALSDVESSVTTLIRRDHELTKWHFVSRVIGDRQWLQMSNDFNTQGSVIEIPEAESIFPYHEPQATALEMAYLAINNKAPDTHAQPINVIPVLENENQKTSDSLDALSSFNFDIGMD